MLKLSAIAVGLVMASSLSAQDTGYIKASGKPGNAGVFVNGKYIGPATRFTVPEKYSVPAGEIEVIFRDPRYEEYKTKVTVTAGKTTKVKFKLTKLPEPQPPFGTLRLGGGVPESYISVAAGDTGAVYINDKFYGYCDELNNKGSGLLLKPGTYDVYIDSPTYGQIRQKVTVEANQTTIIPLVKK
jgi:hypothetical protein